MLMTDLNQEQAKKLKKEEMTALLPIGATEVHGNHLPLGTDIFLAEQVCRKVEEQLGSENCVILPCIPYGQVWSLGDCPGSIHIPDEVLSPYIREIGNSIARAGIRRMAIVNSHVGNMNAIKTAARQLTETTDLKVYIFTYPGLNEITGKVCTAPQPHKGYFHACEIETSLMLYLCPEKVDMEKAICQYPSFPEEFDYTPIRWTELMETAVLGDATAATEEKGRRIIEVVVQKLCDILQTGKAD